MRKALIVGIDDYPAKPLAGCIADANALAEALRRHGDGSPNFDVQLLTSDVADTRERNVRASAKALFNGTPDIALFFFAGHGWVDEAGGYLVTVDSQSPDDGITMDQILALANQSKASKRIIILDCCHAGAFGNPAAAGGRGTMLTAGLSIMTATRPSEVAVEFGGNGRFTSLLLDGLNGGAADLRGDITPGSLYAYVDEALGAWDQRPMFKTNISSFAVLRSVPPKIDPAVLRLITRYFPDRSGEHALDPSYEFTDPSADDAKVEIFKHLQQYVAAGLVVPVGEEHMYFAAINSRSCRLTPVGAQYRRLVAEGRL
ncbi:MAG: caspase family protein [Actinomycetota bacterium]